MEYHITKFKNETVWLYYSAKTTLVIIGILIPIELFNVFILGWNFNPGSFIALIIFWMQAKYRLHRNLFFAQLIGLRPTTQNLRDRNL